MNKEWLGIISLVLSLPVYAHTLPPPTYYEEHAIGWHWYEDPLESPSLETLSPVSSGSDPIDRIHRAQKTIERALDTAILEPSVPHISAYVRLQNQLSRRSAQFAALWQQVLVTHPELNFSLEHPTEALALQVKKDGDRKKQEAAIRMFAANAGLFFFYKASCPYCREFSPIVQDFAKRYGITVLPVTVDGSLLREFPNSKHDQGQAVRWGIRQVPALFAVSSKTHSVFPIAYGLTSESTLRQRIVQMREVLP